MNGKKIAVLSALVLVVLGCIFAAGCTDAGSTPAAEKTTGIVGTWEADIDAMVDALKEMGATFGGDGEGADLDSLRDMIPKVVYQFNADGTGTYSLMGFSSDLTWKSLGGNSYAFTYNRLEYPFNYYPETDRIADDSGMLALKRQA